MDYSTKRDRGAEHGRRLYVSGRSYFDQMRMRTDAHVGARFGPRPHSEDKKPYHSIADDYPEMEHFYFGWDPPAFPFDPAFPPDDPMEDAPRPYGSPGGLRYEWKQGCELIPPRFEPYIIKPGEEASTAFVIGENDDIRRIETTGPIEVVTNEVTLRKCHRGKEPARECRLVIRAKSDPGGAPGVDLIPASVTVDVSSAYDCYADVMVRPCENEYGPEWDYENTPQTTTPPGTVMINLVPGKGQPPFRWYLVGTRCSLSFSRTELPYNFLTTTWGFCGSAVIHVKDDCGRTARGAVRSVDGVWEASRTVSDCPIRGPANAECVYDNLWGHVIATVVGDMKIREVVSCTLYIHHEPYQPQICDDCLNNCVPYTGNPPVNVCITCVERPYPCYPDATWHNRLCFSYPVDLFGQGYDHRFYFCCRHNYRTLLTWVCE